MGKYIDAEKLIAEIERRIEETKSMKPAFDQFWAGQISAFKGAREIATYLQQEQPKLPGYDKALLEVKSMVDELYEEAGIGLCEYDSGLYNGIAETCMKLRGFIKARLGSDEQPDVVLEKEIDACWQNWISPSNQKEVEGVLPKTEFATYACHFYELGKTQRKE